MSDRPKGILRPLFLNPFIQSSLVRQVFYFLMIVGIVFTAVYTYSQYLDEIASQQKNLTTQIEAKLRVIEDQLAQAVWQLSEDDVASIVRVFAVDEQVIYVRVAADNMPSLEVNHEAIDQPPPFYVISRPIERAMEQEKRHLGSIEIGLSNVEIKKRALSNLFINFMYNFLRVVLLVLIIGIFFYRKITKPLFDLVQETQGYEKKLLPYLDKETNLISSQKILKDQIGDIHQLQTAIQGLKQSLEKAVQLQNQFEQEKTDAVLELAHEKERREYYQRMELLGRVTAQVAHDFNNVIFLATLKTESLERKLNPELQQVTRQIRSILHQSNEIIDLLLSYVRQKPKEKQVYSLSALILDLIPLFEVALGRHYNLVVEGLDVTCAVLVEKVSFSSAMLNLLVNARDAQTDGGEIKIALEKISSKEVAVKVMDRGEGIPPELLEKIFEPLFTTKPAYMGTGLGLPQVKDAMEAFGGRVDVVSQLKSGTVFSLIFPISNQSIS